MKRRRQSSSSLNNESEEEGVLYAVFEITGGDDEYHIYKLNSTQAAETGDYDAPIELGQPILTLKSSEYPTYMIFFSIGSKLYFCGGNSHNPSSSLRHSSCYESKAFMFDFHSMDKGVVSIPSMTSPKPIPLVFGPVDFHKFYIFSASKINSRIGPPTFEMLDTSTNQWENLPIPDFLANGHYHASSALCGSNILLSSRDRFQLFVFSTIYRTWRIIDYVHSSPVEPFTLPFIQSLPLHLENHDFFGHILLSSGSGGGRLYLSPIISASVDDVDCERVGPLQYLGDLTHLFRRMDFMPEYLGDWGNLEELFPFNNCNSFCFIRSSDTASTLRDYWVVDIFHVRYRFRQGTKLKLKVKVNSASTYKYFNNLHMYPKHFLVVPCYKYMNDEAEAGKISVNGE